MIFLAVAFVASNTECIIIVTVQVQHRKHYILTFVVFIFFLSSRNFTSSPIIDLWVGLYSDVNLWQWTESLGGNVGVMEPALSGLAMVLSMPGLSMTSKDVNIVHSFACEKAAPSKLKCPFLSH